MRPLRSLRMRRVTSSGQWLPCRTELPHRHAVAASSCSRHTASTRVTAEWIGGSGVVGNTISVVGRAGDLAETLHSVATSQVIGIRTCTFTRDRLRV
jgi:hypothetical protein